MGVVIDMPNNINCTKHVFLSIALAARELGSVLENLNDSREIPELSDKERKKALKNLIEACALFATMIEELKK